MKGIEMKIMLIKISLDRLNSILDTSKEKISKQGDIQEEMTYNKVQRERDERDERLVQRGGRQNKEKHLKNV